MFDFSIEIVITRKVSSLTREHFILQKCM